MYNLVTRNKSQFCVNFSIFKYQRSKIVKVQLYLLHNSKIKFKFYKIGKRINCGTIFFDNDDDKKWLCYYSNKRDTHSVQVKTKKRTLKMMVDEPMMHGKCEIRGKRQNCPTSWTNRVQLCVVGSIPVGARYLILSPACLSFTDQISSNSICMFPSSVFVSAYRLRACFIFFSKYDQVLSHSNSVLHSKLILKCKRPNIIESSYNKRKLDQSTLYHQFHFRAMKFNFSFHSYICTIYIRI